MSHRALQNIVIIILSILIGSANALSNTPKRSKQKKLLILNSYNESAPWSRDLVSPISLYIANDESVHADIFCLNNVLIEDSASYNTVKESLFATYSQRKPDYLVIIGLLGFSLRDEIKARWGDIPILLITRDLTLAPNSFYFSGYDIPTNDEYSAKSMSEIRDNYNFTLIYVPNFYRQTIDLIARLTPGMDSFVFFSDNIYLNRHLAKDIEMYLLEEYPNVNFKWVQASAARKDELQYYFVNRMPSTGMLMSTWFFEQMSPFGYPTLGFGDLYLMQSSVNPIFSLRESYMPLGSIGGVYTKRDDINDQIKIVLDQMMVGKSMREIKFFTNLNDNSIKLNYPQIKEYKIDKSRCPHNTIFVDMPKPFFQKYLWQTLLATVIISLLASLVIWRNKTQRRKIAQLEGHKKFVDSMPVPYSKAKIIYNDQNQVINIKYTLYNEAFEKLLSSNCYCRDPYLIFPNDFISQKTSQLINSDKPISFMYHFEKTQKYYVFTLCFVGERTIGSDQKVDEIDIFAIDETTRIKAEIDLKRTTERLDMTLNVAKLIPWQWNVKEDTIEFDAYSMYQRISKAPNDATKLKNTSSLVTIKDYINAVHPDDRHILLDMRNDLLSGKAHELHAIYRLVVGRKGKETVEWVEIQGLVTERDSDELPIIVIGSMLLITDRKRQELDLIAAKEKASEADKMKSAFLANMSHEIRTPLNAIVGFSDLLVETDDPNKRHEFGEIINQNNEIILALINDVLDYAKIESNALDLCYSNVKLNNVISIVAKSTRLRILPGVQFNITLGAEHCMIVTDEHRLSQILLNLLFNAAKFTSHGSINFGYEIRNKKELYFYVKDTGIGISAENQKQLFVRFCKVNDFVQGSGLGLSISKSLVELLGGNIGVTSEGEGKGSMFWFTIPYKPADNSSHDTVLTVEATGAIPLESTSPTQQTTGETSQIDAHEGKKKILVVRDSEVKLLTDNTYIPSELYQLLYAADVPHAIEMIVNNHPDLLIIDISTPDIVAYQTIDEIRKADQNVPVIALTLYASSAEQRKILAKGFKDIVFKPVSRNDLNLAIRRCLSGPRHK